MKKLMIAFCGLVLCFAVGCRDSSSSHGHSHEGENAHSHDDHAPPHGGTPVIVADDKFHLELVLDATAAKMQAYVLDGHLEAHVQVPETSFALVAKAGGKEVPLSFQRAPEPASGKVPEKSSLFEAHAEWLKAAREFDGSIPTITLNGTTFTNISFSFPKGSKHAH